MGILIPLFVAGLELWLLVFGQLFLVWCLFSSSPLGSPWEDFCSSVHVALDPLVWSAGALSQEALAGGCR